MSIEPDELAFRLEEIIRQVICCHGSSIVRGMKVEATFNWNVEAGQLVPSVKIEVQETCPLRN